jgi:hypothetical protein
VKIPTIGNTKDAQSFRLPFDVRRASNIRCCKDNEGVLLIVKNDKVDEGQHLAFVCRVASLPYQ